MYRYSGADKSITFGFDTRVESIPQRYKHLFTDMYLFHSIFEIL